MTQQKIYRTHITTDAAETIVEKANNALKTETPEAFLCRLATIKDKKAFVNVLKPFFQSNNIAFLVDDPDFCEKTDGLQILYGPDIAAIRKKYPDIALGVVCQSRHEAMIAGEKGADYIAFTGQNAADLCRWWAELFTVPCVFAQDGDCREADFLLKIYS